jgi:hypothetical protein
MSNRKEMITFEVQRMTTEAYRNFSKKTKMNMGKKIADPSEKQSHPMKHSAKNIVLKGASNMGLPHSHFDTANH